VQTAANSAPIQQQRCIYFAGADLPQQSKIFVAGGRGFREITRRSKERIPTISVVSAARQQAALTFRACLINVVMVKKQAQVFLAGPPLVKMATGEISDEESLGGAEMHSRIQDSPIIWAEDELDAIRMAREIVSHFNLRSRTCRTCGGNGTRL